MKKVFLSILIITLLMLCACAPTTKISGTYTDEDGVIYEFGGTGVLTIYTEEGMVSASYELTDPDQITIRMTPSKGTAQITSGTYTLENGVLTITGSNGKTDVLQKQK